MRSHLHERKQSVKNGDAESILLEVVLGVPQGVLGPLLFIIYFNDIVNVRQNLDPALFADDAVLLSSQTKFSPKDLKSRDEAYS